MFKHFRGSWCPCWPFGSSGQALKFLSGCLWKFYRVPVPQLSNMHHLGTANFILSQWCACPTSLFFAKAETYQFWHCYKLRKELKRFRNGRKKHRHDYFPNPIYEAQSCSQTPSVSPSGDGCRKHYHHWCWCSAALSLRCLLTLHLEREGQTGRNFLQPCLLPCSLHPIGLDFQAVLNRLEIIFHPGVPCQFMSIDTEAQKNRLHPLTSVCFV